MTQYRVFYRTDNKERLRGFEPIEAGDDTTAIRDAEAQQRAIAVELWCANRLVKKWDLVQANANEA